MIRAHPSRTPQDEKKRCPLLLEFSQPGIMAEVNLGLDKIRRLIMNELTLSWTRGRCRKEV
jgi:hypothetical protein